MKIGVFDSGLGGLFILKAITKALPRYDFVYLGDTKRVPYGNRSRATVYKFLRQGVEFLFDQNCELIIVACNTASAEALRKIQREYLPEHFPSRRVLGVIIPTVEEALKAKNLRKLGVLATLGTVKSRAYIREIKKINPKIEVIQEAAPLLVEYVENNGTDKIDLALKKYLRPLLAKKVEGIILGCTHYPILKKQIRHLTKVPIICQDEFIGKKLAHYLKKHSEIDDTL